MAISTETKRRTTLRVLPKATGVDTSFERRQALFIYPFGLDLGGDHACGTIRISPYIKGRIRINHCPGDAENITMQQLDVGGDSLVEWVDMQKSSDDSYIDDATVMMNVKDSSGTIVASAVPLNYVSASNGLYQGVVDASVALTATQTYFVEITAVSGLITGFRRVSAVANYRAEQ